MPAISVMMITKNRAQLLKRALLSILKQSFSDYEVVIVNDGSSDETNEVISEYATKMSIIQTTHLVSQGIVASRQEALGLAKGEYLAILDDDDVWIDPDKLKQQFEYLERNRSVVITGSSMEMVDDSGTILEIAHRPLTDAGIRKSFLFKNPFLTSTVCFRTSSARAAGGFVKRGTLDIGEDYDLWLRIGALGSLHNSDLVTTRYRYCKRSRAQYRQFLKQQYRLLNLQPRGLYPHKLLAQIILLARIALVF